MADQELEMMAVIGKIAAALSQSAGHTVEVYKAEESMPNFPCFYHNYRGGRSCGRDAARLQGYGDPAL